MKYRGANYISSVENPTTLFLPQGALEFQFLKSSNKLAGANKGEERAAKGYLLNLLKCLSKHNAHQHMDKVFFGPRLAY